MTEKRAAAAIAAAYELVVAPVVVNRPGSKSAAIDYQMQPIANTVEPTLPDTVEFAELPEADDLVRLADFASSDSKFVADEQALGRLSRLP